jgi:hypothetical protein
MSTVTDFRFALQADLAVALGFEFVGGIVEPPQTERNIGCVWFETKRPHSRDGNMEEVYYRVRVFRLFRQGQGVEDTTRDITGLEELVEDLQAAFRAVLTTLGHDFFTVLELGIDYPGQFVEAALVAYQRNLGARGG